MRLDFDSGAVSISHFGLDVVSRDHPLRSGPVPHRKFDDQAGSMLLAVHHCSLPFPVDCGFWSFLFD